MWWLSDGTEQGYWAMNLPVLEGELGHRYTPTRRHIIKSIRTRRMSRVVIAQGSQ